MDCAELRTAIQDYCQNSETTFVSHINDFIIAAEDKIFSVVSMPAFWKSDLNQVCADGTAEYTLDVGVMDIFSVRISEGTTSQATSGVQFGPSRYLIQKDYDFLLEAYPGSTSGTSATITGISQASEAVVTATNTFANDDLVYIDGVAGMTQVNGNFYRVSDRSDSNFKIKSGGSYVISSGYGAWTSGGIATSGVDTATPKYYSVSSAGTIDSSVTQAGILFNNYITGTSDVSGIYPGMDISGTNIPTGATVVTVSTDSITISELSSPDTPYIGSFTYSGTEGGTITIRLGPIPNAAYPMTVDYYGKTALDSITANENRRTWLSVTFPDVLLYGALVEAYIFMKGEPDILQSYQGRFNEGISMIKNFGEGRQASDNYSVGPGPASGPMSG